MTEPIYLAGPVEQTDDPRSWRDVTKSRFPDLEFIDPMDFQTDWNEDPTGVIAKELGVCETHPILANNLGADGPRTVGTHHEIAHALANGNDRIAAVCVGEPAGFIRHRVTVCDTVEEAIGVLTGEPVAADGGNTLSGIVGSTGGESDG